MQKREYIRTLEYVRTPGSMQRRFDHATLLPQICCPSSDGDSNARLAGVAGELSKAIVV